MAEADIGDEEVTLVSEVVRSALLTQGRILQQFEQEWAASLGVSHAVAVSSGTAGLHLAMIAAGVEAGDCVITTPFSFVASANAILYERGDPIFVDIDPDTLNINPELVAEALHDLCTPTSHAHRWRPPQNASPDGRVRAVLPVHVFGRSAAMPEITAAAATHGVPVIEDACEAIGARVAGRAVGTHGDAAVFGFFPNKQMTAGEGGMITTQRQDWADLFRSLRNQGRAAIGAWLDSERLGYNYRLSELHAALGLAQLRRLDDLLAKRARVAAAYASRLDIEGVRLLEIPPNTAKPSWFVCAVRLSPELDRDAIMDRLHDAGVPSRPYFPSIHLLPFYRRRFGFAPGDFPAAEAASRSILALPFSPLLDDDAIDYVVESLRSAVRAQR